ncbi:MAG: Nif3-like dinuclear metal center hexameric protein, partial [[Clostridium] leptum]
LPCCVMGTLAQPMEPKSFAAFVKERLSCEGIRYVAGNRPVRKVALCSGAGGEFLFDAMEKGADAFVTGEVKHHEILAAKEAGLTLVDGGHFKTEDIAMEPLRERLSRAFPGIEFFLEENAGDGIRYL